MCSYIISLPAQDPWGVTSLHSGPQEEGYSCGVQSSQCSGEGDVSALGFSTSLDLPLFVSKEPLTTEPPNHLVISPAVCPTLPVFLRKSRKNVKVCMEWGGIGCRSHFVSNSYSDYQRQKVASHHNGYCFSGSRCFWPEGNVLYQEAPSLSTNFPGLTLWMTLSEVFAIPSLCNIVGADRDEMFCSKFQLSDTISEN